jgi:hypothetical protein
LSLLVGKPDLLLPVFCVLPLILIIRLVEHVVTRSNRYYH